MHSPAEKSSFWHDRFPLEAVAHFFKKKSVPTHRHTIWYYLGGMTLFFFIIQVGTGILLLLYYRPTAEAAFESVQFIMTKVQFGWLIRSIHSWSANLMVATAMIHMFSVFFMKAYRQPREITWLSGVLLFFLALGFGFSGYLLPFFPYFLLRDLVGWVVALGVLIALAALFPWELGEKADPFASAPPGIKPEWYFLFMFQSLKYIPAKVLFFDGEVLGILGFGLVGLFWLLVPFIDRRPEDRRTSRWFTAFGWAAIAFIIIMSLIAYVIPQTF